MDNAFVMDNIFVIVLILAAVVFSAVSIPGLITSIRRRRVPGIVFSAIGIEIAMAAVLLLLTVSVNTR